MSTSTINNNDLRIHVTVPILEGHADFNETVLQWADSRVEQYKKEIPSSGDGTSSLNVSWHTTGLSSSIAGFHFTTEYNPGASTALEEHTVWYETVEGELLAPSDFISSSAWEEVEDETAHALRDAGIEIDDDALSEALKSPDLAIGFTEAGELFLGFDAYTIAPGYLGSPSVSLAHPDSSGWLTETGEDALDATIHSAPQQVPKKPAPPQADDVDCEELKCVALTFDDGPSGEQTPRLLKMLGEADVSATFFVVGSQVHAFPKVLTDIVEDGHELANHTWSHPDLTSASESTLKKEIARTNDAVKEITGKQMHFLRPPYGATNKDVSRAAAEQDMVQVLWDIDTRDWDHLDPKKTLKAATEATPGSIILMHDIHESTVDAVPRVIKELEKKGFTLVTVSELLGPTEPGEKHSRK